MTGNIKHQYKFCLIAAITALFFILTSLMVSAEDEDPFKDIDIQKKPQKTESDQPHRSNFFFQKEFFTIYESDNTMDNLWTVSAGFEIFKKFSSRVRDTADLDLQMRVTRVERTNQSDSAETMVEWHNAFLTFYNPLGGFGKLHFRVGHFDQPFGLETITDTHGTLLQLSNMPNFGFKKDWGAEIFGDLSPDTGYDIAYTMGSGMYYNDRGQSGILWGRLGTTSKFQRDTNSEIGLSFATGERLQERAYMLSDRIDKLNDFRVRTERYGLDYRLTKEPYILSLEGSVGKDEDYTVRTILGELEYQDPSKKWESAIQYKDFFRDTPLFANKHDRSLTAEFDWYFDNTLRKKQVIRLNYTRYLERITMSGADVWMMQYYLYF